MPLRGTNRLGAGYAVVAAVTSVGVVACGQAACAYFTDAMTPVDDGGADEVPALANLDGSPADVTPADASDAGVDGSDAADGGDAAADAKDAGLD